MKTASLLCCLALCSLPAAAAPEAATPPAAEQQYRLNAALVESAFHDDVRLIEKLLQQGAEPNTPFVLKKKSMLALSAAAWEGNQRTVALLLRHGADPSLCPEGPQSSPLWYAVTRSQYHCARLMLEARSWTAAELSGCFREAVAQHNAFIAELLRRHGADPNTPLADGSSVLSVVAQAPQGKVTLTYLLKCGLELRHPTPAVAAAAQGIALHGDEGCLDMLLEAGYPINAADAQGDTLLSIVAFRQDAAKVAELLARGADPRSVNRYGIPLLQAVKGHADIDRMLEEAAARLNAEGRPLPAAPEAPALSPLFQAVRDGEADTLRRLLAEGANVNELQPESQDTPLLLAIMLKRADIARLLLEQGADAWQRNSMNCSPVTYAIIHDVQAGREEYSPLICPEDPTALSEEQVWHLSSVCAYNGAGSRLQSLLESGALDPHSFNAHYILVQATLAGHEDIVALLLRAGVSPFRAVFFNKYAAFDYSYCRPAMRTMFEEAQKKR